MVKNNNLEEKIMEEKNNNGEFSQHETINEYDPIIGAYFRHDPTEELPCHG